MMKIFRYSILILCLAALFQACKTNDIEEHNFDNKLFIKFDKPVENLFFEAGEKPYSEECELVVGTALRASVNIVGKIVKAPELKEQYNQVYNAKAELLPDEMCIIEKPDFDISLGGTESLPVSIKFVGLEVLDRTKLYVMPVKISAVEGIDVLASKTETYFVFKGASLVNIVADIAENNFPVKWSSTVDVKKMRTITVEALIKARDFGPIDGEKGEGISTIFGVEGDGNFLVRVGDASVYDNQLQIVSPSGKFPEKNSELGLPTNEWVHIAVVWSSVSKQQIIYVNGIELIKGEVDINKGTTFDLSEECYVGKSWNDERWLDGEIAELRIWNVQRTQEEIANNIYRVDPTKEEGLIAYWKFNEGTGRLVHDWSGNGNDITAVNDIIWNNVALPE